MRRFPSVRTVQELNSPDVNPYLGKNVSTDTGMVVLRMTEKTHRLSRMEKSFIASFNIIFLRNTAAVKFSIEALAAEIGIESMTRSLITFILKQTRIF